MSSPPVNCDFLSDVSRKQRVFFKAVIHLLVWFGVISFVKYQQKKTGHLNHVGCGINTLLSLVKTACCHVGFESYGCHLK